MTERARAFSVGGGRRGLGRKAVDFATLSGRGNCREYVAVHHRLGVDAGDRLLDVACGSGSRSTARLAALPVVVSMPR
jgi:hypothetical protein